MIHRVSNNLPGLIRRACPPGCPSDFLQQGFPGLIVLTYYATKFVSSRLPCTSFEAGTVLCHHVSSMTTTGVCQLELNGCLKSGEAHQCQAGLCVVLNTDVCLQGLTWYREDPNRNGLTSS
jgi:hypothetical protein